MEVPSRSVLMAICLNISERLQVPSVLKLQECFKKNSLLTSLTRSESQLSASVQLGLSALYQGGISCCLELGGFPQSHLQSGSTQRHALHRIWEWVPSFGPRRLLGHWCRRSSQNGLFFHWGGHPR